MTVPARPYSYQKLPVSLGGAVPSQRGTTPPAKPRPMVSHQAGFCVGWPVRAVPPVRQLVVRSISTGPILGICERLHGLAAQPFTDVKKARRRDRRPDANAICNPGRL